MSRNTRRIILVVAALFLLACGAALAAAATAPWIHVEVEKAGSDAAQVKVQVPLALARVALQAAPLSQNLCQGKIHVGASDVKVSDLRKAWTELEKAGDAEFVTVTQGTQQVHVRREGDNMVVRVEDGSAHGDSVLVTVPVEVVDALLSGAGDDLDLGAAMEVIGAKVRGDLVRVAASDGTHVRVFVD